MRPLTIIAALGTAGGVLAACAGQAISPAQPVPASAPPTRESAGVAPTVGAIAGVQSILKFKDPSVRGDAPEVLARLESVAGAKITYVRAMSGDAHVIRIAPVSARDYDDALARLRHDASIEYVEPDARMTIQR